MSILRLNLAKTVRNLALALSLIVLPAGGQVFAPLPYLPGQSFGPLGPIQNIQTDQDSLAYAAAFWQSVDSGNPALLENFQFQFQGLLPYNNPAFIPVDVDPFQQGRVMFEDLYSHRLNAGFGFEDLVFTDPLVGLSWRFWTYTHQVATADFIDPLAHQKHILALIDAVLTDVNYGTRGVPYFDPGLTIVVSDRTKKKTTGGVPANPVNVTTLAQKLQDVHAHLCAAANVLMGFGLYQADGTATMPGFDCDDFADAFGAYLSRYAPEAGVTATSKYVSWTTPTGAGVAHLVTKISFCGYYWLMDAQTGGKLGPFPDGTPLDAAPLINAGYEVGAGSAVTTSAKCYALGDRGDWKGEPPPWYTCGTQVGRFEMLTGYSAACFVPAGVTPAPVPATGG